MIGPVLHNELLLGGRRNRLHVLRWVYGGLLVLFVLGYYVDFLQDQSRQAFIRARSGEDLVFNRISAPEVVGQRFAHMFIRQQLLFLLALVPAFVAGAITDEKRTGTLQYLLLTEIESRHIILGKMLGRVAQVCLVLLAGFPLFALMAGFAGVPPITMLLVLGGVVLPLIGLAAAALLVSVWFKQTRDAVLALYGAGVILLILVHAVEGPFQFFDPHYVIAPAWGPIETIDLDAATERLLVAAVIWGLISVVCLVLAVWRMRPAYLKEMEGKGSQRVRWYQVERMPVDEDPVRWREREVEGLAPNPTLRRVPQWLVISFVSLVTISFSVLILAGSLAPGRSITDIGRALLALNWAKIEAMMPGAAGGFLLQAIIALLVGSLIVAIRLSAGITTEREKQTWEALLLTPLSAKQIIHGKLWGVMAASYWYLLAYAAPAVVLSSLAGPVAVFGTLIILATTVLAMYCLGSLALWCSVRCENSWRSLFFTLLIALVGGTLMYTFTLPVIGLLAVLLYLLLSLLDTLVGTGISRLFLATLGVNMGLFLLSSVICVAGVCLILAREFVKRTVRWVADRDRTRYWSDEPVYRRSIRRREYAEPWDAR